jgi:hypothetical protein
MPRHETLPIPDAADRITIGGGPTSPSEAQPTPEGPHYFRLEVPKARLKLTTKQLKFTVKSDTPISVGVYGPNPPELSGKPGIGRIAMPGPGSQGTNFSNVGKLTGGTYYLVVRFAGEVADYTIDVKDNGIKVF